MGPNNDVQKYDPISVFKVLPWYVICLNIIIVVTSISNWSFLSDDGEQVLVDLEGKDQKQISQHVKKILGKTE